MDKKSKKEKLRNEPSPINDKYFGLNGIYWLTQLAIVIYPK